MANLELVVRDYLRANTDVMAYLNSDTTRVNMDYTGTAAATHVTIYRAGGAQHAYMPVDSAVISVNCFGSTRPSAAALADLVAKAMRGISNDNDPMQSCTVESIIYLPTTEGVARYVVTTVVTAHITANAA